MYNKVNLRFEDGTIADVMINDVHLVGIEKISVTSIGGRPYSHLCIEMDAEICGASDNEHSYDISYVGDQERRDCHAQKR